MKGPTLLPRSQGCDRPFRGERCCVERVRAKSLIWAALHRTSASFSWWLLADPRNVADAYAICVVQKRKPIPLPSIRAIFQKRRADSSDTKCGMVSI